jgi:hypothetical protein
MTGVTPQIRTLPTGGFHFFRAVSISSCCLRIERPRPRCGTSDGSERCARQRANARARKLAFRKQYIINHTASKKNDRISSVINFDKRGKMDLN